ncbi:hypothetical protein IFM58399_10074 [Aspergillus lentulus]|uniref:uncharacterized protein n=1 Tax=Aspergillus lentulus TaxID=293939 RepID=UPI001393AF0C|nr:uncharacterized protein IFM58399_10074 [Aspergillus lentulus]GFF55441.1 hypothetical protein IFM58399_10074 [Aspergillus lentulus]GFF96839.1 hypothetical protein IFM47457_11089 [Aspergillus lentulus]
MDSTVIGEFYTFFGAKYREKSPRARRALWFNSCEWRDRFYGSPQEIRRSVVAKNLVSPSLDRLNSILNFVRSQKHKFLQACYHPGRLRHEPLDAEWVCIVFTRWEPNLCEYATHLWPVQLQFQHQWMIAMH